MLLSDNQYTYTYIYKVGKNMQSRKILVQNVPVSNQHFKQCYFYST
jgi:hypothetical protein